MKSLEYLDCLKKLMKFPRVNDVRPFIQDALIHSPTSNKDLFIDNLVTLNDSNSTLLAQKKAAAQNLMMMKPSVDSLSNNNNSIVAKKMETSTSIIASITQNKKKKTFNMFGDVEDDSSSSNLVEEESGEDNYDFGGTATLEQLKNNEKNFKVGSQLERIVGVLQTELFRPDSQRNMDALLISIAELKHLKDILKYQLPYDEKNFRGNDYSSGAGVESEDMLSFPEDPYHKPVAVVSNKFVNKNNTNSFGVSKWFGNNNSKKTVVGSKNDFTSPSANQQQSSGTSTLNSATSPTSSMKSTLEALAEKLAQAKKKSNIKVNEKFELSYVKGDLGLN